MALKLGLMTGYWGAQPPADLIAVAKRAEAYGPDAARLGRRPHRDGRALALQQGGGRECGLEEIMRKRIFASINL